MVMLKIKPEKQVEMAVDAWAFQNRWSLDRYDSKGTFSDKLGRYTQNIGMKTGTPDRIGCDSFGHAVFLELKRSGQSGVCRLDQRTFLARKIQSHAFGMVVDSIQALESTYSAWLKLHKEGKQDEALKLLMDLLPKKVIVGKKTMVISE